MDGGNCTVHSTGFFGIFNHTQFSTAAGHEIALTKKAINTFSYLLNIKLDPELESDSDPYPPDETVKAIAEP